MISFTLRQLEYLDAVASEGSISGAAERSHVSASGLALAIDELERHLGVQVIVRRKGRGITLTPAGSRVLSSARQLLASAEGLADDAAQAATALTGRFRVGCFTTLTPFFVPGMLQTFGGEHPELELEFVEGTATDLHEQLLQGRIDVALLYAVDVSPQLDFDIVHAYRPYALVAEGHRFAKRRRISLAELIDDPLVMLDVRPARQNTERVFDALDLHPRVEYLSATFELVRCLVGRDLGYAVMFQRAASGRTYDGHTVVGLDLTDEVPPTIVGLVRPAGAPRTARYTALQEFLVALTASAGAHASPA